MNTRVKSFIVILLVLIVVLATVGLVTNYLLTDFLVSHRTEMLQGFAQIQKYRLEQVIEKDLERLRGVTSRTQLRLSLSNFNNTGSPEDQVKISDIIQDAKNSIPDFEYISIVNPEGRVVASTNPELVGDDDSEKEYFVRGLNKDSIFLEQLPDVKNELLLSGPLTLDGNTIGVAVIGASDSDFISVAQDYTGLGETGETIIAWENETGDTEFFIRRRFEDSPDTKNIISQDELTVPMTQALSGNERVFTESVDYRGNPVVAVTRNIEPLNWGLVVKQDEQEILKEVTYFWYVLIFSGVGALFLGIILSYIFSGSVTRPLRVLQRLVQRVGQGNLRDPIKLDDDSEIGDLADDFESMRKQILASRTSAEKKVEEQTRELRKQRNKLEKQRQAIVNILEDVSAEKNVIALERDRVDKILQSIGDGVLAVDSDYRINLFNKVAEDISGLTAKDVMGARYDEVLKFVDETTGEKNENFVVETMRKGKITSMGRHTVLVRRDEIIVPVADSAAPLRDSAGNVIGVVIVFRDVSKEREIDRMKTEFVSVASHQLRTPLSAIKWFLELVISGDLGKLNKDQMEHLEQAYSSNERMIHLVNDLLNASRIESGKMAIEPKLTNIAELSLDIIREIEPGLKEKGQHLDVIIPQDLPKIKIDGNFISQVLQNLFSNASKYSPGKSTIEYEIKIEEKDILFRITDHGYGIPKKQQHRAFGKFFRADNVVTKVPEGTGLGLYTAKSIIESSGGKIWFDSQEGKGTTFWFTLPLAGSKTQKGEKSLI